MKKLKGLLSTGIAAYAGLLTLGITPMSALADIPKENTESEIPSTDNLTDPTEIVTSDDNGVETKNGTEAENSETDVTETVPEKNDDQISGEETKLNTEDDANTSDDKDENHANTSDDKTKEHNDKPFGNIEDMRKLFGDGYDFASIESDCYTIHSFADDSKSIDIAGASQINGTQVQLYGNNNSPAQRFIFDKIKENVYRIQTDVTDKTSVLKVDNGSVGNGTRILQEHDKDRKGTYFTVLTKDDKYIFIVTDENGTPVTDGNGRIQIMDLCGAKTDNGTWVWTWEMVGENKLPSDTQTWTLQKDITRNDAVKYGLSRVTDIKEDWYNIISSADKNYAVDVAGGSSSNGANIRLWDKNYADAQKFYIENAGNGEYRIKTSHGKSVDVCGVSPKSGANVWQWENNDSQAQLWKIYKKSNGQYVFVNSISGKALDVSGNRHKTGQNIQVYDLNACNAQSFRLVKPSSFDEENRGLEKIHNLSQITSTDGRSINSIDNYKIHPAINGGNYTLDIANARRGNGTNVQLCGNNNNMAQHFKIQQTADGEFVIKTGNTNFQSALDVSGNNNISGTNVHQWQTYNNADAQKWNIYRKKGTDQLIFKKASGYTVLDISGGRYYSGNNIGTWFFNGSNAQLFCLERVKLHEIADVPYYNQNALGAPEGCEGTSLLQALRAKGYQPNLTLNQILDAMPKAALPVNGFVGSPYNVTYWLNQVIYPAPFTSFASRYCKVENISHKGVKRLKEEIKKGNPCIIWVTVRFKSPNTKVYSAMNGWRGYSNIHVMTLTGYNEGNNSYRVTDPLSGSYWVSGSDFEGVYNAMDIGAVAII